MNFMARAFPVIVSYLTGGKVALHGGEGLDISF